MNIPPEFREHLGAEWLDGRLERVGYPGKARYIAFWWEPIGDELAYADSDGNAAAGTLDHRPWIEHVVQAIAVRCDLGSSDDLGADVLIWSRSDGRVFIAPRGEGLAFLGRQVD